MWRLSVRFFAILLFILIVPSGLWRDSLLTKLAKLNCYKLQSIVLEQFSTV